MLDPDDPEAPIDAAGASAVDWPAVEWPADLPTESAAAPPRDAGREAPGSTPAATSAVSSSATPAASASVAAPATATRSAAPGAPSESASATPGAGRFDLALAWLLAAAICVAAYLLAAAPTPPFTVETPAGPRHPLGPAIAAILLGLLLGSTVRLPRGLRSGLRRVVRVAIPAAIVLSAAELDLRLLSGLSVAAIGVTLVAIVLGLAAGAGAGRLLRLTPEASTLLGAGTAVCGNSAVVAAAPVVGATERDVGVVVGTINLVGLLAMLAMPPLGVALALSPEAFGVWAGASLHAVPQVVAAGESYGPEAAAIATLVKLSRVALLAPVIVLLALSASLRRRIGAPTSPPLERTTLRFGHVVPWFVWGFLAVALINTLGLMPSLSLPGSEGSVSLAAPARRAAGALLATAMGAIGLDIDVRSLARVGLRAVSAGLLAALALMGTTMALVLLLLGGSST